MISVFDLIFSNSILQIDSNGYTVQQRGHGPFSSAQELTIYFTTPDKSNILTEENIRLIKDLEETLFYNRQYQAKYCLTDTHRCVLPASVARLFDGSFYEYDEAFYDPDLENLNRAYTQALEGGDLPQEYFYRYIGRNAEQVVNATTGLTTITTDTTALVLYFGLPLVGFDNYTYRVEEQTLLISKFMKDEFVPILERLTDSGLGNMDVCFYSTELEGDMLVEAADEDMVILIVIYCVAVVIINIKIGSLFIANSVIILSALHWLLAHMIHRYILQYTYFGYLHIETLFIQLIIVAGELFFFVHNWKKSLYIERLRLEGRLHFCNNQTSCALTLASMIPFIFLLTLHFAYPASFAVFTLIMLISTYIFMKLGFPIIAVTYNRHFEMYEYGYCCSQTPNFDCCLSVEQTCYKPVISITDLRHKDLTGNFKPAMSKKEDKLAHGCACLKQVTKLHDKIANLLVEKYYVLATHRISRWFVIGSFLVMTSFFLYALGDIIEIDAKRVLYSIPRHSSQFFPLSTPI